METGDVSTPYSSHFDDIYFAVEDGLAESRYVFLEKNNLPSAWTKQDRFTICETGFGTGLNFLCAWTLFEKTAAPHQKLHYYSFEKYPLSSTEIKKYLMHWSGEFDGRLERLCAEYPLRVGGWHTLHLTPRVTLTLMFDDANRAIAELDVPVDCWFLDGHAPAKNPDMWSDNLFAHMGRLSTQGARFATFTAAGFVRRGLAAAGFDVAKDRGFGRKRDMSVGVFRGVEMARPDILPAPQKIAIIGGGIAGAACVSELVQRGVEVHLFEKHSIASGGSGNMRGLFNPRFTAQRGFEADFYGPAFSKAHHLFQKLSESDDVGYQPCGSLHLVLDEDKHKRFRGVIDTWGWHSDHLQLLDNQDASRQAGINIGQSALFLPEAGMVNPARVTAVLAGMTQQHHMVEIADISAHNDKWKVGTDIFDAVVIAGGVDTARFLQTSHLPLQSVRGQISYIRTPEPLSGLRTNLCYGGYCTRPFDGQMVVGSTFQHWLHDRALRDEDHRDVLEKMVAATNIQDSDFALWGGRAAFRCAAKDRVPIIGQIDAGMDGLHISAAHGSHGLLSAQMGAMIIAADMFHDGQIVPRSVSARLSPQRFSK